ncbi:DUF3667 domain-containing protein [Microbulbifer bruguierae]|uniref:DUF3667 domain-containing protein n=1 Tax=Microbulbifer bruguierae TaxID=3029061 RepID=A0ABY8NAH1_9GAMM|nr:DUF3667 domain-containing protein [Microbulbifer bruguierae]WGL15911.1 DUF3667 domain-containing protein [Microbulbifer bruguierae]
MSETDTLMDQGTAVSAPEPDSQEPSNTTAPEDTYALQESPVCGNCETPLLGPHCHACGQPAKSLLRHFPELIGDFFGSVFGLDSRIARTFGPLLLKPGFLTNEYFAGRRVRYVSPVRLFVFLCLTAFFVAQLSSDWNDFSPVEIRDSDQITENFDMPAVEGDISTATTVEEVIRLRDQALEELQTAAEEEDQIPGIRGMLKGMEHVIRDRAQQRIAELDPAAATTAANAVTESGDPTSENSFTPLQIDGAPEPVNAWLARQSEKLKDNVKRIQDDPNLLKDALFGSIPSALFLLLPFFALLLGILYLFKRRLYMEHLIVALHSHAFLSLALLLMVILFDLRAWLTEPETLSHQLFSTAIVALGCWMPIYLLLMQKRVYGQGWFATSVKYVLLGSCYLILLLTATTFTALASVATL